MIKFEWTPGVGDGQGGLACCNSWGRKELDTTEQLNWTELNWSLPNSDNSRNWCHIYISEPFTDHSLTGTGNTKANKIYSIPCFFFFLAEQFQRDTGKPNTKVLWWELCVWSTTGECETWEAVHLLTYKLAKGLIWYAVWQQIILFSQFGCYV